MQEISIRNRNRDKFNYLSFINNQAYSYYTTLLRQITTSLFKWEGLPNNIPERFIEKSLYNHGALAFFNDNLLGFIVTKTTANNSLNIYEDPISWNCFSVNYSKNLKAKDCVIIRNNIDMTPTRIITEYFANKLWHIDVSINQNISLQKFSALCKCSESQRLTFENLLMKYEGGEPIIFANKSLDTDGLETLNFDVPFIAKDLHQIKSDIFNECLSTFGINNANTSKRERLNIDEVNSNNQYLSLSLDNMLLYRQNACREIKEKFNIDVSVKLREEREVSEIMGEVENG